MSKHRTPPTRPPRTPVRLALVMSDGTLEPVDLDEQTTTKLVDLDFDSFSDRLALCEAVRFATNRFKPSERRPPPSRRKS